MTTTRKNHLTNEKGFTLIEIIAVIIIMGILAAVAVPKFFSMQEDAKIAALKGALSESAARFNHAYARYILDNKVAPSAILGLLDTSAYLGVGAGAAGGASIGDFSVKWTKVDPDGLIIEVVSAETIPGAALAALAGEASNTVEGVNWGN